MALQSLESENKTITITTNVVGKNQWIGRENGTNTTDIQNCSIA
jgi:hypothetical protein